MATSIQVKRGATAKVAAYTPLSGELVLDTTTNKLYAGDGATAGGNQIVASRKGITDASSAAAGEIGEIITNTTTGVSLTTGTPANLTSITLTPGDWDVDAVVLLSSTAVNITLSFGGLNTTSATLPSFPNVARIETQGGTASLQISAPSVRFNISANTTVYLVGQITFPSGTGTGSGYIRARRMR